MTSTTSMENRVYSFYAAKVAKPSSMRNRKTALDTTVRTFGISYQRAREIIETRTAQNLGMNPEEYRRQNEEKRQAKRVAWDTERAALIAEGHMAEESKDNPHSIRSRLIWHAEHCERVAALEAERAVKK